MKKRRKEWQENQRTGTSSGQTAGRYATPLSGECIRQFWDPQYYNWLSFENNCGQAIHLSFIANSPSDHFGMSSTDIAPGHASNTGWSKAEVARKGGFALFVCPAGYGAVDANTDHAVRRGDQTFRCKK